MRNVRNVIWLVLVCVAVASCGGGGGGGDGGGNSAPPSSPVGLTVSAGDTVNALQWNSVTGATGYNIYWSTVSGMGKSGTKLSGVASPYNHSSLTNSTTYYYVVTAVNAAGESAASAEVAGTPAAPSPSAPTLMGVTPANQKNTISWSPVMGATSYNLYWSTTSGAGASATKIANVVSPYVHTALTNGVTYYYSVTALSAAGESAHSGEIGATPLVPPYATQAYPFDLGTAPLTGYLEALPDNTRQFYYTLSATPGATYMFHLDNVRDGATLEVFNDNTWNAFSLACGSYRSSYAKFRPQCPAVVPATGIFYIRVAATTQYAESVTLSAEQVVNQGSIATPVDLGAAPHLPSPGTVLENGQSVYKVAVTPGNLYRVTLQDWADSGASLSTLFLGAFDGAYAGPDAGSAPGNLCTDYSGGASVSGAQHRLSTIHCLAKPTANFISIVAQESQYGKGATYKVAVENALKDGTAAAPVTITGAAPVYAGTASNTAGIGYDHSYYKLAVTPNTSYMVDLRGMHVPLDLIIAADSTFLGLAVCNSRQLDLIDESCVVNSGATGTIYAMAEIPQGLTDKYVISAIPTPVGAASPARYPGEGASAAPVNLGSAPVANRLSTVGTGMSYYSVPVTPGSTLQVSATQMNVDVDVLLYSDAAYLNRLCASRNIGVQDDVCTVVVPAGITTMYIAVDGQFTTNNGDWASGTALDVGGMFRLSVQ
ncbi:MAG TPA: fibronectin type III domain-containing protein [Gallionellaceae bacterium]